MKEVRVVSRSERVFRCILGNGSQKAHWLPSQVRCHNLDQNPIDPEGSGKVGFAIGIEHESIMSELDKTWWQDVHNESTKEFTSTQCHLFHFIVILTGLVFEID